MRRTILAIAFAFSFVLLAGCGSDEKKEDAAPVPPAEKMFDKSKLPVPGGGGPANKKASAG